MTNKYNKCISTGNVTIKTKSPNLRGVLLADLFELLVPGRSAVVGFLPEPGDHVCVLVRVDHDVVDLQRIHKAGVWLERNSPCLPGLLSLGTWDTYVTLIPLGQVEFVGEEVPHVSLIYLFLQHLQEVSKPLEGVCFPTEPIEIDLRPGNKSRLNNDPLTHGLSALNLASISQCENMVQQQVGLPSWCAVWGWIP